MVKPHTYRFGSRRRPRRGLTVFIVLLVIGMLFAVGTFAAKMASSGVSNAGRFKQMQQTHYLSEMGVQATLSELQRDPNGYRIMMRDYPPPALPAELPCKETPRIGSLPPANDGCVRVGYTAFEEVAQNMTGSGVSLLEPTGALVTGLSGTPGSLGGANIRGNFAAELTDLILDDPPPGFPQEQASHMAFLRVTVMATGQVVPFRNPSTGTVLAPNSNQLEFMVSQEETRAQVLFGPVPR
jgi:hypothetical protein